MKEREKFEAWSREFYGDLACASDTWSDEKGTYTDYAHHLAWHLWQDMQSRLESLEKDAARYQWLRSGDRTIPEMKELNLDSYFEDELDEAIDTAMQANKGE